MPHGMAEEKKKNSERLTYAERERESRLAQGCTGHLMALIARFLVRKMLIVYKNIPTSVN